MHSRIKQVREYFGLNQTDFGAKVGIKQSTVATNENGTRPISERTISAICREFAVDRNWLETGVGNMFVERSDEDLQIEQIIRDSQDSPAFRSMLSAWSKLDEKNKEIFLDFVQSFVNNYQANKPENKS